MIWFSYILLMLALAVSVVVFLGFVSLSLESMFRGHDLPTSMRATKALIETIKKYKPGAKIFYDIGCGRGTLSLRVKKELPSLEIRAVDNSVIRIFFARLKSKIFRRNIDFNTRDIFNTDLSDADVVFAYLWYDLLPPLEKKLQKELKTGSVVITNTSHFQDWQPVEKVVTHPKISKTPDFETLFVYVKK